MRDRRRESPQLVKDRHSHVDSLQLLASNTSPVELKSSLSGWWRRLEGSGVAPPSHNTSSDALPAWCIRAVQALVGHGPGDEPPGHYVKGLHFLLAEVAAEHLVDAPSRQALDRVKLLLRRTSWSVYERFEDCVVESCETDGARREPLLELLQEPASYSIFSSRKSVVFPPMPSDPLDLLGEDEGSGAGWPEGFWPSRILFRLDLRCWCQLVDSVASPAYADAIVRIANLDQDERALLAVIERSPAVLDQNGAATGSVTALFAVGAVVDNALSLVRALQDSRYASPPRSVEDIDQDVAAALSEDVPTLYSLCWKALLHRSDGLAIAVRHLEEVERGQPWGQRARTVEHTLHSLSGDLLATALAQAGRTPALLRASRGGGGAFLASLRLFESTPPLGAEDLTAWCVDLLGVRDPTLLRTCSSFADDGRPVARRIARALVCIPAPAERWRESMQRLQPAWRQQGLVRGDDQSGEGACCNLWLRVGFALCDLMADPASRRELFNSVFEAAMRTHLITVGTANDGARLVLAESFVHAATLRKEVDDTALIASCLARVGDDWEILIPAASHMLDAGIDIEVIDSLVRAAGASMVNSLAGARAWADRLGVAGHLPPGFAEVAGAVAKGGVPDAARPTEATSAPEGSR